MKKIILLCIALIVYQKWDVINNYLSPTSHASNGPAEVTLYATSWCGYCKKTRALLDKIGVAYTEYDIEESYEGLQQYEALNGQGIPLLVIDDEVIRGYNPSRISKLLQQ